MMKRKREILLCMLSFGNLISWANDIQPTDTTDTLTVEVYYRQGLYKLDSTYLDNRNSLNRLLDFFSTLSADSTRHLNRFHIVSGASPEGSTSLNKTLSKNRTNTISDYFLRHLPAGQSALITKNHVGIDWENLKVKVEHSDMPYKEEVLQILNNTPEWVVKNGVVVDSRKKQLMTLRKGSCWRYIEEHIFPQLRRSLVEVEYTYVPIEQKEIIDTEVPAITVAECCDSTSCTEKRDSTNVNAPDIQPSPRSPFYMAVKTNLLYDALLVPNVGVEFYLGKGFSVGGNWMYAWWRNNNRHRYWRIYGGEVAVRKYFNRTTEGSPMNGHHIGVYGQIFTYDFETGGRGYMGGRPGGTLWEKMNYSAGLEYGYSLPIASRLNLDFVIGLGYWGGTYYEYLPMDNHYVWQSTQQRHWFGPTKAEISLVWLLGHGNFNVKKGGKR